MRILFCSWPGYGHLLPMVPLLRAAQRAGHDVVVSSGRDLAEPVARLGVPFHPSGLTQAESYARLPHRTTISALPPREQAGFAARHLFGAGAVDRAADVLDLVRTWRPDLVVHDMMEMGSAVAALRYGVAHVTHGYGPLVPGTDPFLHALGSAVDAGGLPDPVPAVLAAPYLEICPPGLHGPEPGPWRRVLPLRPSPGEVEEDADLPGFADLPAADTVYVTLGTVMNQSPDVFRAVVAAARELPVNLVLTTGPGFDPAVLGPVPPTVVVAAYLPQAAVLPHCRAVVSHAGAGTMLGALCHGLPQLCLPRSTDQPFNAAALLRTGAALALAPDDVTAASVAEALGRLLAEPAFRRAAQRLRDQTAAMPAAGAVLAELLAGAAHPS